MSMVILTQGTYFVSLPEAPGFAINPQRMTANRTAFAGNIIRQESALHASSAEATYNFDITRDKANILKTMYLTSSSAVLWYQNKIYSATFHPVFRNAIGKQTNVSIKIGIVREIQ